MIVHLLGVPDKTTLVDKLRGAGVRDRFERQHKFIGQDESGEWRWDESRICRTEVVAKEAIWDHSDPENPLLVSPQETLPGLFILVALKSLSAKLTGASSYLLAYDGETGKLLYLNPSVGDAQLAKQRISPVLAGSICEFGPKQERS